MNKKQLTITKLWNSTDEKPDKGDMVYLVSRNIFGSVPETVHEDTTTWKIQKNCPITNRGMECSDGWLGDSLGHQYIVARHAWGLFEVKKVVDKPFTDTYGDILDKYTIYLVKVAE